MVGLYDNFGQTISLAHKKHREEIIKEKIKCSVDDLIKEMTSDVPGLKTPTKEQAVGHTHLYLDELISKLKK